jgi:aminoglycoside 2''-phosphotransferase
VHSLVPGQALSRRIWEGYDSEDREATAAQLAGFLDALHGVPSESVQRCGLPTATLGELLDRIGPAAEAVVLPRLSDDGARRLEREYEDWSARIGDIPAPVLLHCDVDPSHVLVSATTRRLTGVIDFSDLALGDQARDFIFIYEDFGPNMLDAVVRHYRRENGDSLMARIRAWYLFDLISWILTMHDQHNSDEVARGVRVLSDALAV